MSAGKQDVQAMRLVLTCEHAFPEIPEDYRYLFRHDLQVLRTHEAYDLGSFDLFKALEPLADFSHFQNISRLLVECNRSVRSKNLFSRYSAELGSSDKSRILDNYYWPYREIVEKNIHSLIEDGQEVIHVSVHSFTPVLHGMVRNADIGLLYDPRRLKEKEIANFWKELLAINSDFKLRSNYPYLGKADGFTTSLRKLFPENYSGIEIEVNQKWVNEEKMNNILKSSIFNALQELKNKA
ncbi:N-formylglutamate amidohydrolase [Gramella lutea]|uniref:N-formylglutamate amidohydrolase n=1 Tax=Christiangramia lutea TaxID=1607951 RepID=A0A9X1V2X0_9FLAO|nr:N-formylglutamate amidohydrolase [Christiangramia lutea]MCH4823066.1 N-formylglutamate amidohydrolase [Christiangramia lutea]